MLNNCGVSLSAPGSRFSIAKSADASSTILLTLGRLAPFSDQLIDERDSGLDVLSYMPLCPLDATFHGGDPQFVLFQAQDNLVTWFDAERFAEGSWYYDAAVFVDPQPRFCVHVIPPRI